VVAPIIGLAALHAANQMTVAVGQLSIPPVGPSRKAMMLPGGAANKLGNRYHGVLRQ